MNSVISNLCVCSIVKKKVTNKFFRCRNGCKLSLAPKNGGKKIAFQASVLFFGGLKLNSSFYVFHIDLRQ